MNNVKEENENLTKETDTKKWKTYNMVCLNNVCPFPKVPLVLDIGKENSKLAIKESKKNDEKLLLGVLVDGININDIAVVTEANSINNINGSVIKFNGTGITRARIVNFIQREPFYKVEVEIIDDEIKDNEVVKIYTKKIVDQLHELQAKNPKMDSRMLRLVSEISSPSMLCDAVATSVIKDFNKKLNVLNTLEIEKRLEMVLNYLLVEVQYVELNERISEKVKANMDKSQKEYYLREQMKAISEELGDDISEIETMEQKIKALNVSDEIKDKLIRDLNRLRKLPTQSPDSGILRNYIDTILGLPWNVFTEDNLDLDKARKVLDEDHSGLEKIKERIIEYLACMKLTGKVNGQIICFAGPPGVGKTSIARSIARALGRNFVKMSLGGIKDEAEIRGHRKTYIGAMPGRVIYNMRLAKVSNPLFLIDEIDKLGSDYKGDPSSAMLEVLDPEQNFSFRDNFLEIPYDLSQVLFIATANDISKIPAPLRDRMEIIELSSYTDSEKLAIAKNHLVKKEMEKHGLKAGQISIKDDTLNKIISEYTFEAGVRNLERLIASVCRKCAVKLLDGNMKKITVAPKDLKEMLGAPKKNVEKKRQNDEVGVVSGLYYTPLGGGILNIEVYSHQGKGEFKVTGQLGDVMKESAQIAISVLKTVSSDYQIDLDTIKNSDIHIHVPEGAVKKDGPSAGIALTTALVSQFSNRKVDCDLAMTGEIGLRGEVLPIGGLKEKLFACVRCGISKAIVPAFNKDDIDELPNDIKDNLKIHYANNIQEVLSIALV